MYLMPNYTNLFYAKLYKYLSYAKLYKFILCQIIQLVLMPHYTDFLYAYILYTLFCKKQHYAHIT